MKRNKKLNQISLLYGSLVINVFVGVLISVINTRNMSVEDYGKFKYIINLFTLAPSFLHFGFFIAGQRLLASEYNQENKRKLIGIITIIGFMVSLALTLALAGYSFIDDLIFNGHMGKYILFFSPLVICYIMQRFLERIFTGINKIKLLALMRTVPKILYIIGALILLKSNLFRFELLLLLQLSILLIVYSLLLVRLKPIFASSKSSYLCLIKEVKDYGIYEYWGMLINAGSDKLSVFIVLYYLTISDVGFFSLAGTVSAPLMLLASAIGTSFYKEFANRDFLPAKATKLTLFLGLLSFILYAIGIKFVIKLLYSDEYLVVVPIAIIMGAGFILRGIGEYINKFIGAHGYGKYLRNASIINSIINILGYFILINLYGLKGAAITKFISGLTYLITMLYIYNIIIKKRKNEKNTIYIKS